MSTFEVPEWLNKAFVKKLLRENEADTNISIASLEVKCAVREGENYLGILNRMGVTYTSEDSLATRKCFLIVKSPPSCKLTRQFMDDVKAIQTETHIYRNVLPAMYQIVDEREHEDSVHIGRLTPKFFGCSQTDTLIMEDLMPKGYTMKERRRLLDFVHAKAVVKALACFHGLSRALYLKNPSVFDNIQENQFTDSPERLKAEQDFSTHRINTLLNQIEKWPGYEHYIAKLSKATENLANNVREIVKPIEGSVSVLNHGDCWVNNILFHYNSITGDINDVRFIDFQMCRFSSPVLDLHYFLYTSVREKVIFQKLNDLLEEYHAELSRILKTLKCTNQEYTFCQFKKEFEEKEYFGFFNAITKLCAVLAEPSYSSEEAKLLGSSGDNHTFKNCGNNVLLKDMFRSLLPYFESKGFI